MCLFNPSPPLSIVYRQNICTSSNHYLLRANDQGVKPQVPYKSPEHYVVVCETLTMQNALK